MKSNVSNEKPIHYLSHKLTASQTNWPIIEKEAFAIFYTVQKLNKCLFDSEFVIRADHKPLKYVLDSPGQNKNIQHWITNISGYNCKIEYIEGKKNVCVDMLSCFPHRPSDNNDYNELSGCDTADKTFEVSMMNISKINPKAFAQYNHQITDNNALKKR